MTLNANHNYGNKRYHHIYFGLNRWDTRNPKMKDKSIDGGVTRLLAQDITNIGKSDTLLQLGNIWGMRKGPYISERNRWHNIGDVVARGATVWYWDNPSLPHLLYETPANPQGYKNWMRLVKNTIATDAEQPPRPAQSGTERINRILHDSTGGLVKHWQDIVGTRACPTVNKSRRALICPSSAPIFTHYAGCTVDTWTHRVRQLLETHGYTVFVRGKPGRQQRNSGNMLWRQLQEMNIGLVVGYQSMSSVEALLAGVPVMMYGCNPVGALNSDPDVFANSGTVVRPDRHSVDVLVDRLLCDVYHKWEAYSGAIDIA